MTTEDRQNYEKIFAHFDKNQSGRLSDEDMQQVIQMTKSSKDVCALAWELSNPNGEDFFTKPMFMVAMHLLYKKKKDDSLQLPSHVPQSLLESSGLSGPIKSSPAPVYETTTLQSFSGAEGVRS